jgi:hypothetical protein
LVSSGDPDALARMNAATKALEAKEKVVHVHDDIVDDDESNLSI